MKTTVLPQIFLMRSRPLGETLQATVPVMTKWTAKTSADHELVPHRGVASLTVVLFTVA
jgi:hypothetical protein